MATRHDPPGQGHGPKPTTRRPTDGEYASTFEHVLDQLRAGQLSPVQAFRWLHDNKPPMDRPFPQSVKPAPSSRPRGGSGGEVGDEQARLQRLQAVQDELRSLIGLDTVKQLVLELQAFVEIQRRRAEHRLQSDNTTLHMVFKGNPGTGKTTVARVLGRMFRELKALPKGHLVECERADLVGEFIGHTAQRTRERIRKALGGILFIDEAYALARGGEKDFGKEAIDTLVKAMEDHKDQLIVILAGYRDEMDSFLASNPGLRSRFPVHIDFPDYSDDELLAIADLMCAQRQYRLSGAARRRLASALARTPRSPLDGNARYIRNILERAMRRQALRLVGRRRLTREELMTLEAVDLWEALAEPHRDGEKRKSPTPSTPWPGRPGALTEAAQRALADLGQALGLSVETELSAG